MGVCEQNICFHFATFCASNKFDMQHDHVLKKWKFYLLTLRSGVGVCEQNSCYHVATFCDSNIFDMQMTMF